MKKTVAILLLIILVLASFAGCGTSEKGQNTNIWGNNADNNSSSNCPSNEKIKEDVTGIQDIISDRENAWTVVEVEETLAQEQYKAYETSVKVKLKNSMYNPAYKTVSLSYTYYDKGGWVMTEFKNVSSVFDAVPITGYDEGKAYSLVSQKYDGRIQLDKHTTDLNNRKDQFVFNVSNEGLFWNEVYSVNLSYITNDTSGLWTLSSEQKSNTSMSSNNVDKWFYHEIGGGWDDYNDYVFYYLDQFDGMNASIIVVDLAINGRRVQGHNFNLMPDNTIHSDDFVCYKMECRAYYDEDTKKYSFGGINLRGAVSMTLSQNALYAEYMKESEIKSTAKISDVISLPTEVNSWLQINKTN